MYCYNDSWNVIFKNDGKPLVGKIEFCDPVTTELKTIYDVDHEELTNPIYCNGLPSHQVMLDNGDYTVRYYEYIGNGNMESDENVDSWRLYKTELVKQNVLAAANDTTGITATCTTIEQLKEMEVPSDGSVVGVVGYYTAEDCPLRYYVWHQNGNYTEDGGVVIKSNHTTTGAWVMKIPGTYIDVRWYGDIPSNNSSGETSSLGQRVKAANAANKYDKDLYFPSYSKGSSSGYYLFDGSNTVSVEKNIICDWTVLFVVKSGTSGTKVSCKELEHNGPYLFIPEYEQPMGGYAIEADWIRTAWFNSNTSAASGARVGYIIDRLNSSLTFTNTRIKVNSNISSGTFNNCEIVECYKQFSGSITFYNMEIHSDWFADNEILSSNFIDCKILLRNCKDADEYISLKNKIGEYDYGDLEEQELHNAQIKGNSLLENCTGTIVVSGSGPIEMHNASVTVTGLTTANSLVLLDTWITFNENTVVSGINLWRGSITSSYYLQTIGPMYIDNADLYCQLTTLGQSPIIKNCNIYNTVNATNITLTGNKIYNIIYQHEVDGVINVDVCDNYFGPNGLHSLSSSTQNTVVKGRWMNNRCGYDTNHWITIDRTNLKLNDCEHDYAYIGNEEPWIEKYTNSNSVWTLPKYRGNETDGRGIFATTTVPFLFWNTNTDTISIVNRHFKWRMFTVGTQNTLRNGHIWVGSEVFEGEKINMSWGKVVVTLNGVKYIVLNANCVGGYEWSFEDPNADHTTSSYSNGRNVGHYWVPPDPTMSKWTLYPTTYWYTDFAVFIDKDFESRPPTTIQNV